MDSTIVQLLKSITLKETLGNSLLKGNKELQALVAKLT